MHSKSLSALWLQHPQVKLDVYLGSERCMARDEYSEYSARFTARRMAQDYVALYRSLGAERRAPLRVIA